MQADKTTALLGVAMNDPEQFVCHVRYLDASGSVTDRVVSPICYLTRGDVRVYCLGREAVRTLKLSRILLCRIGPASEVLCPEAIQELVTHHARRRAAPQGTDKQAVR